MANLDDPGQPLGRLEPVDPRSIWPHEAQNFTPWLAENADRLADALGIELEVEGIEVAVGGYALDLLGRDQTNGVTLIVENQLESSDHTHLGQLLTYAAGTGASTIVWITTRLRDEHRQALTWLNEHTDSDTHFFGVELEVVRIGASDPAPLFTVVAKPNDWGKAVKAASGAQGDARGELYRAFWTKYLEALSPNHKDWTRGTPPTGNSFWMSAKYNGIGYVSLFAGGGLVRHGVYIDGSTSTDPHAVFDALQLRREEIEVHFDAPLEWDAVDGRKVCRITERRPGRITQVEEYDDYLRFFIESGERFRAAFGPELLAVAAQGGLAVDGTAQADMVVLQSAVESF